MTRKCLLGTAAAGFALAGLCVSLAQFSHYFGSGLPALERLCSVVSPGGCDDVRSSEFSHLFNIPVPLYGALFFMGALLLAPLSRRRARIHYLRTAVGLFWALGGMGAAAGFLLISLFWLDTICAYCLIQDICILAVFVFNCLLAGQCRFLHPFSVLRKSLVIFWNRRDPYPRYSVAVYLSLAVFFFFCLIFVHQSIHIRKLENQPGFPPIHEIHEYMTHMEANPFRIPPFAMEIGGWNSDSATRKTAVQVVEFLDLQCPYCLRGLQIIFSMPDSVRKRVRFSLVHFPLCGECNPRLKTVHPNACRLARLFIYFTLEKRYLEALALLLEKPNISYKQFVKKAEKRLGYSELSLKVDARKWEIDRILAEHLRIGNQLGLEATPVSFVDGIKMPGFANENVLSQYLQYRLYLKERTGAQ